MKRIYFHQHAAHVHSLYRSLFAHPPEGFTFIVPQRAEGIERLNRKPVVARLNAAVLKRVVNTVGIKDRLFSYKDVDADLIYSAGYLVHRKQPWVADFEFASGFTGYDDARFERQKERIRKTLESPWCKALLPWDAWAAETLFASIDSPIIRAKTHVVYVAIEPPQLPKRTSAKPTLLFLGSANLPQDFYHKGGAAAFEVYRTLKKRHDIKLIVRCRLPDGFREGVAPLLADPDVEVIEGVLPQQELEAVFARSDILISPTVQTPILAYLEAMGRGIPVVTTDAWANAEIVAHGRTGIVVEKPDIAYHHRKQHPIPGWKWENEVKRFHKDEAFIARFAEGVEQLLDTRRRRAYGTAGRKEITHGKFSIAERNRKLGRIFAEATR